MKKQLFKYLARPRDLFDSGFIRLTQPSALNDPFEASYCSKSLDELASHFDDPSAFDIEYGETSFSEFIENRMHHVGIISFSENKENLLMWAHYADEHRGLVAGISYWPDVEDLSLFQNLSTEFYAGTTFLVPTPFDGRPRPVMYRKGLRYRNDKFDYDYSNISVEGADRFLFEVFLQKSDEWIYEQEHRVILRLEQADRVIVPSITEIENLTFRHHLLNQDCTYEDPNTGVCTIDLMEMDNQSLRSAFANNLAKLSQNPEVIYLMKLSSSAINNCLVGLNSKISKEDVVGNHASKHGCLDVWKARKNQYQYILEFEEI